MNLINGSSSVQSIYVHSGGRNRKTLGLYPPKGPWGARKRKKEKNRAPMESEDNYFDVSRACPCGVSQGMSKRGDSGILPSRASHFWHLSAD